MEQLPNSSFKGSGRDAILHKVAHCSPIIFPFPSHYQIKSPTQVLCSPQRAH